MHSTCLGQLEDKQTDFKMNFKIKKNVHLFIYPIYCKHLNTTLTKFTILVFKNGGKPTHKNWMLNSYFLNFYNVMF